MTEHREDYLTDHSYDGIQEYDNPLPGWWKLLFWGSFVFSVLYWVWFHVYPGKSIIETWEAQVEEAFQQGYGRFGDLDQTPANLVRLSKDADAMQVASSLFQSRVCSTCHANDGGGKPGLGANFCDDNAINFTRIEEIPEIIRNGVDGTSMTAQSTLSDAEVTLLAAYVANFRGTTPAAPRPLHENAKPIPPWPAE